MTVSLGQERIDPAYRLCLAPLLYSSQALVLLFSRVVEGDLHEEHLYLAFLAHSGIEGFLRHQYNASHLYLPKFL